MKSRLCVAYGIGIAKPISIYVNTFDTHKISEEEIKEKIEEKFDLTPDRNNQILGLKTANICKDNELWAFWKK